MSFVSNAAVLKGPKSAAGIRKVPLIPQLKDILVPIKKDKGYIVSKDGETLYSDTAYSRAWYRIAKQIDMCGYTAHSFRHTVASIYASDASIAPKTVQTMLGHADIATTMNVYAKTDTSTLSDAGRLFSEKMSNLVFSCKDSCNGQSLKPIDK